MRKRIAAAALGAALLGAPAAAYAYEQSLGAEIHDAASYEQRYLEVYERYAGESGKRAAGRNIVLFGVREKDGDVRKARKPEVVEATDRISAALSGGSETPVTATATDGGAAAASSTAQCESGGDYGAVNPAGYYGAYQFDQSTWDAYAPEGYAGTNPAAAPPAVQDAAAASVPYDAWPSCP